MVHENPPDETEGMNAQPLIDEYQAYRRFGARVIVGGMLVLLAWMSVQAWFSTQQAQENAIGKVGVHLLLDDGRNRWESSLWAEHMRYAGEMASTNGIAVQVIRNDDLDTERWQLFLDLADDNDLTPVLRLATTFDRENGWWNAPEPDADGSYTSWGERYAAFINDMTWIGDSKHVILLNEPNNGHEWSGSPDAAAYAQFVVDVADVLRNQVEGVVILNGALDLHAPNTNGEVFPNSNVALIDANTFMNQMEAAQPGIFATFTVWNSHSYPLNFSAPPSEQVYGFDFMNGAVDSTVPPPDGIFNRGINGYVWERWKLEQLGYNVANWRVMLTETGWRHSDAMNTDSADAGDYPTPETVANYYEMAFQGDESNTFIPWLEDDRVIAVAPFALSGVPDEWSYTNLLQVDDAGAILGSYAAFDTLVRITTEPDND